MPKTVAPISHEAIKRSLKSKFKLILSENRILVDTINGYVKRAEKVYKEMESTEDVTPKQFAKAMEKLERAYSACVRLILVASDLFEKGDSEGMKTRETATSSCESETSVYSSESSATITDSNRTRKMPNDRSLQKRSRSSDVRLNEATRVKTKTVPANRKSRGESSNTASERFYVRSGSCSEFDHLIELQRFLHGLEKEKLQTDHPNPCVGAEKQPQNFQVAKDQTNDAELADVENKQASPEVSRSQSLTQRLKILKTAIENFKDRSSGDERVTQALNDIRELVLKNKEKRENFDTQEAPPGMEGNGAANIQVSPVSESVSTELHRESGSKACSRAKGDHLEIAYKLQASDQKPEVVDAVQQNKLKESSTFVGKTQQGSLEERKQSLDKYPVPTERTHKINISQRQDIASEQQKTVEHQQQVLKCETDLIDEHLSQVSPAISSQLLDDDKEDINHIIVNKIVDMVSAKLAPRLRAKNGEDRGSYLQFHGEKVPDNTGIDESGRYSRLEESGMYSRLEDSGRYSHSPTHMSSQDMSETQTLQQGGCCGNFTHFPQHQRHHFQPQLTHQQQEMLNSQRRQQRPKMVSFMDDYEDAPPFNAWNYKLQNDSRKFARDCSPTPTQCAGPLRYAERDSEQPSHYLNQQTKFSSPHKRRIYSMQQPIVPQRVSELQHQQCTTHRRKLRNDEDISPGETDFDLYKEGPESEQVDESDSEIIKEYSEHHQLPECNSKSTPSHESLSWANRPLPKNHSTLDDSEGRVIQRERVHQQQASKKSDSFDRKAPVRSPNSEMHQPSLKDTPEREWFSSSQKPVETGFLDSNKVRQSESDAQNRLQHRFVEKSTHDQRQEEFAEWRGVSIDEHFSDNSEWAHNQSSPKTMVTHNQKQSEVVRPFPIKMPRSTPPKVLPQRSVSSYTNVLANTCGYSKFAGNEVVRQASETSCEASPVFSIDDRLQTDAIIRDEPEGKETKNPRPEVVCIDTNQLHADASRTITLSNLPLDLEETELLEIFKKYGHVTKIYYIKDRNTGMFQGRAYGKFSKSAEAYQAAQDLQNLVLDGHEVCVQLYVTTP